MRRLIWLLVSLLLIACSMVPALAHESQPGTLEIQQLALDRYDVIWKAPIYYGKPHPARLQMPGNWKSIVQPTERRMADAIIFAGWLTLAQRASKGPLSGSPGLNPP